MVRSKLAVKLVGGCSMVGILSVARYNSAVCDAAIVLVLFSHFWVVIGGFSRFLFLVSWPLGDGVADRDQKSLQ